MGGKPELVAIIERAKLYADWWEPECGAGASIALKLNSEIFKWINKYMDERTIDEAQPSCVGCA